MASSMDTCYTPGGGIMSGATPCNSTAGGSASACCDPGVSVCTTTGYCFGTRGYLYRGGCTDPTWNSPACARGCKEVHPETWVYLYRCDTPGLDDLTNNYCCGTQADDGPCCNESFTTAPGVPFANFVSQNTSDSSSTSQPNPSTSPSCSSTSLSCASTSLPSSTMGVAVGIPLTALLLVVGGIWALRERRWRHKLQQRQSHELRNKHENQPPNFEPGAASISEVPAVRRPTELESRDQW